MGTGWNCEGEKSGNGARREQAQDQCRQWKLCEEQTSQRKQERERKGESMIWGICHLASWIITWLMLISYLLSQTHKHARRHTEKNSERLNTTRVKAAFVSIRRHKRRRVRGAAKSKDEKHSKDEEEIISRNSLTKPPTWLKRKRGMFHFHLSVYDMSRKGEHIKCMSHKCVCLCATPTPCREGCIQCCRRDKKKKGNFVLYLVWLSN